MRLEGKARVRENPGLFLWGTGKIGQGIGQPTPAPEAHKKLQDDVELRKSRSSFRYQAAELVMTYQENDADDCPFQHTART